MKYIKTFDQHTLYENYIDGFSDRVSPNVSYCKDTGDVHYESNKYIQVKYNVTDVSSPTKVFNYILDTITAYSEFESLFIDNKNISLSDIENGKYIFIEPGEHTIKFYIPILTETITNKLFEDCTDIISVLIPDVKAIGVESFKGCTNLSSVTLHPNVDTIKASAFNYCRNLTEIDLSNIVTLEQYAFFSCKLSNIDISSLVGVIPESAFTSNIITSINIPNTVTSIEKSSLSGNLIQEVIIPSNVTYLGINAFYLCSQLSKITLPENLLEIGNGCFAQTILKDIIIRASVPPILGESSLPGTFENQGTIYVPDDSVSLYREAEGWSSFSNNIQPISLL